MFPVEGGVLSYGGVLLSGYRLVRAGEIDSGPCCGWILIQWINSVFSKDLGHISGVKCARSTRHIQ